MVLKELQIDSFGRFRGRNILLSEGMNILYGGNASGKSTVRDYILFVFFGKEAEKWMQTSSLDNYLPRPSGLMEGQIRFSFEGKEISVTITIGVAYRKKDETIDRWIQRADEKLYYVKEHGRNQVAV